MERRTFEVSELRAAAVDNNPVISGYAAVFNARSDMIWGEFREVIAPGAFAESLQRDDIRALWQHDTAQVLGRKSAGTLTLVEDDHGLQVEIHPPNTQTGRDAMELIRRGDVSEMSFGFSVPPQGDEWSEDTDGTILRTVRKAKLVEVSPVTFPAYPQTAVNMRSQFGEKPVIPDQARGAAAGSVDNSADVALRAQANQRQREIEMLII